MIDQEIKCNDLPFAWCATILSAVKLVKVDVDTPLMQLCHVLKTKYSDY